MAKAKVEYRLGGVVVLSEGGVLIGWLKLEWAWSGVVPGLSTQICLGIMAKA